MMDAAPAAKQRAHEDHRALTRQHVPTLAEIRGWPATVDVPAAGLALGLSRSHAYALARGGQFPAKVLIAGGRLRVITASLLALLAGEQPESEQAGGVA